MKHTSCPCGEPAVWFMDPDGDPLLRPLCNECFAEWLTTEWPGGEDIFVMVVGGGIRNRTALNADTGDER